MVVRGLALCLGLCHALSCLGAVAAGGVAPAEQRLRPRAVRARGESYGVVASSSPVGAGTTAKSNKRPVSTSQTALRQLARLFAPPGDEQVLHKYQTMPFAERIARITVSWLLLFAAKSLLLASPLYYRQLIDAGSTFSDLHQQGASTTLLAASAMGLVLGYGGSRLAAGLVQLVSELILSPATTICAEGLPLEAFACALVSSAQRGDGTASSSSGARPAAPLSAIAAASGGQDEGRSGFARRALDRGLRASNQFLYRAIFSLLPALVEGLAVLVLICVKTSPAVGATAAAVAFAFVVLSGAVMKARIPIMRRLLQQEGTANGLAEDALSLAETVAAFGATELEVSRYAAALSGVSRAAITVRFSFSALKMMQAGLLGLGACAIALVTWQQSVTQLLAQGAAAGAKAGAGSKSTAAAAAAAATAAVAAAPASIAGQLVLVQALFAQLCAPLDHVGQHFRDCVSAAEDLRELECIKAQAQAQARGQAQAQAQAQAHVQAQQGQEQGQQQGPGKPRRFRPSPRLELRNVTFAYSLPSSSSGDSDSAGAGAGASDSNGGGGGVRTVLRQVSLSVPAGGFSVGLVGPSGSGKSSLLRVLLGLERLPPPPPAETGAEGESQGGENEQKRESEEGGERGSRSAAADSSSSSSGGQVLVDGADVTQQHRVSFFAMVGQEADLFRGLDLAGNVRYGTTRPAAAAAAAASASASASASAAAAGPAAAGGDGGAAAEAERRTETDLEAEAEAAWAEADRRALDNAARDAQLQPLLASLAGSGGWAAPVGPRGRLLSGGERQRVCLARALYRQELTGGILLMDEVTASLDAQTESLVTKAILGRVKKGATAVLVAHRLSSVRQCDLILVLRDGAVVERGTHAQLVRKGGWYAQAVRLQGARGDD